RTGEYVFALAFAPDGKALAAAGGRPGGGAPPVRGYDPATGRQTAACVGHQGQGDPPAFPPDGKTLASAGRGPDGVRLWDPATGRQRAALAGHRYDIHSLAFAPDGKTLASADWSVTHVWDVSTGKPTRSFPGTGTVTAFAPDGKTLATVS